MSRPAPALIVLVLAAGLSASAVRARPADAPGPPIFPYPIRETKLENGLTVISVPFDSPGIIAYYTVVRTGSRNEVEPGVSGFAHFFEHMMFRGTETYSETQYNDALKALGADSNAFTSDDLTCYHMTVPASALAKAVELEADRFQHLKYDEPAFQKEARAVLGEYNKSSSNPIQKLFESLRDTAYDTHTYKHTTIGFLADIQEMPNQYAYSKTFFDRWYRPDNCTVVVAGDVNHETLVELCEQHYGAWKPGTAQVEIATEPPQDAERVRALTWPTPTLPTLVLGYHVPGAQPSEPDYPALMVLAQAVFGETSPLYKRLVLDEQKAITFSAGLESNRDPGLFILYARVPDKALIDEVRTEVEKALADAAATPLEPARLDAIKAHLRYGFAASLDSADAVALALADSISTTGKPTAMNDLYAAFDRLTPADLQRVAGTYFKPSNRTVITLTTDESKPVAEEAPR